MRFLSILGILAGATVIILGLWSRARFWRREARRLPSEDEATLDMADRLWKSDPATAQRILSDHFEKDGEREDAERADLRAQARTSRAAAEELRRRLLEDLEVWGTLLKDSRKKAQKAGGDGQATANLEQWEREARLELAEVDDLIRTLAH